VGKLVRDKIHQIIRRSGRQASVRVLNEAEYRVALNAKLQEEVTELRDATSSASLAEELADVLEVLQAIAVLNKLTWHDVEQRAQSKRNERGGFSERLFLES
jgi:predicted house-cleaning noncanonical NTP pyrophosphatase (MazG superfamily)